MATRSAKRKKLKATAVKIGSTIGKVDGAAHRAVHRATTVMKVAKREFIGLSKRLRKSTKRVKLALQE